MLQFILDSSKSMDWFLYDNGLRHKLKETEILSLIRRKNKPFSP